MGYFNPISYFIRSFIRIFTRKFFWVILICISLFLGFILFGNSTVFGATTCDLSTLNDNVKETAKYVWEHGVEYASNQGIDIDSSYYFLLYSNSSNLIALYISNPSKSSYRVVSFENNGYDWFDYSIMMQCSIGSTSISYYHNGYNSSQIIKSLSPTSNPQVICNNCTTAHMSSNNYTFIRTYNEVDFLKKTIAPYFVTTDTELQTFDFDYLQISGGTTPYYTEVGGIGENATLSLKYIYNGVTTNIDLTNYITVNSDNTWSVNIPYNALTNDVIVRNGKEFRYEFKYEPFYGSVVLLNKVLTYDLTTEQEQQINEDSDKQLQGQILQQQQETTQKIEETNKNISEMNNNITDSSVDDSNVDDFGALSNGFETEDVSGIDQLFQKLYDAFCIDEIQEVSLTIPFVNKSFTINTTNVSDNFPEPVKNIVAVFVWGVIGLWVLKDIRTITDKISEGNPENVGSDVKKEVL